ncbi:CoA transferase [Paralcaligenes sp. KSB-10]|uniref:CaiB/BaiF CoA transferase family protein n=1 Tax=Paralcaligenes sp. KSB-10 TaxID=2901142 RepID=UPI001E2A2A24|nr:CoA transferase [Paralcaligenes sp. KSB-10]UHL63357.1 CoA transferase [Paralcaligenes sp. KSB-10]
MGNTKRAPLQGIKVLDLTSVVVGPVATQFLADYGAEVIKIEAPEGDLLRKLGGASPSGTMSAKFLHLNRNKRSVVLNLKTDEAKRALKRLCAQVDVVVVNMRPKALERAGLTYDDLKTINPRLIHCSLLGFGRKGRYANRPAYDSIIQGASGIASVVDKMYGQPGYVPMVMADHTVGLIAVQMILMALYQRSQTGEGEGIEIPMLENMAAFVMAEHMYLRTFDPPLGGNFDPRVSDPQTRPIKTKDGYICLSANTDRQAFGFFDAIGHPELKEDSRFCSVAARFRHTREYFDLRSTALLEKTTQEWLGIFDELSVPAMPYNTLESLPDDPHIRDVGLFQPIRHPTEGDIWNIGLPNTLRNGASAEYSPPPALGADTQAVLKEFGIDADEIAALISSTGQRQVSSGSD